MSTHSQTRTFDRPHSFVAYLKDKIYLFSTLDDPVANDDMLKPQKTIVPPNPKLAPSKGRKERAQGTDEPMLAEDHRDSDEEEPDLVISADGEGEGSSDDEDEEEEAFEFLLNGGNSTNEWLHTGVPVVHPRRSYSGHRSRDTIKDGKHLILVSWPCHYSSPV